MTHPHTPDLATGSVEEKRQEILRYFHHSFDLYDSLFSVLATDDAFYQRPEKLRHPLIFYYGHTATFFINKLLLAKLIDERINPEFESLFAVGVDEMSWDDLNDAHYDWPSVEQVRDYRRQVRTLVSDLISTMHFTMPVSWESLMWPVVMGIEHERIHLETSSVLIRQLDIGYLRQSSDWPRCEEQGDAPANQLVEVPAGKVSRSKSHDDSIYGWDNEYGTEEEAVGAFKAAKYLVSNGEFLKFVKDGGYQQSQWWEQEGNRWRDYTQATHPVFWVAGEHGFDYRSMLDIQPLPLNWPVDVNYHEAKAFCNWLSAKEGRSIRLPTEHEWLRIRDEAGVTERRYAGDANIHLSDSASSVPVDRYPQGEFFDVVGNVWQWTETPIYPMAGFKVHPLYDDFTTPTFDNKHNLIKGGSWISTGNEATRDSRYAFRRHFFQHAGFRYIESDSNIQVSDMNYESDTQVSQYCEFHYGQEYFGVPNFAKSCAQVCLRHMQGRPKQRALDLGCAVGRSAFELAREFDHVDAVDFSARFIKTAAAMQANGEIRYSLAEEGTLTSFHIQRIADMGLTDAAQRVRFMQGDACNLKPQFDNYDLIFMGNLLDRVYSPRKVLQTVTERLNTGGILVVASPFTWLDEYTEPSEWLGGFKEDTGETLTSTDALERELAAQFIRLDGPFDIPFVIRETKRKYQHSLSECSVFQKRS
ncbi:5-histidylcysteine sulfoxide synthase [Alteromonas sp. ASW11-19]|uniref:5-histidylcysteine sulfoxide synthase n=1 Tax=Alteromonas salexigens TaxID=2982530 RepID=A0ABT2VNP3_9ALTE|nr:5-histidylcysteine sulfoxide synthase [Alteromonas salexigens]MCU7554098.1 5-histidylcysteine sulfoxide synthase [Alteromonas salexigens]